MELGKTSLKEVIRRRSEEYSGKYYLLGQFSILSRRGQTKIFPILTDESSNSTISRATHQWSLQLNAYKIRLHLALCLIHLGRVPGRLSSKCDSFPQLPFLFSSMIASLEGLAYQKLCCFLMFCLPLHFMAENGSMFYFMILLNSIFL